jgi:hypothetical protein
LAQKWFFSRAERAPTTMNRVKAAAEVAVVVGAGEAGIAAALVKVMESKPGAAPAQAAPLWAAAHLSYL